MPRNCYTLKGYEFDERIRLIKDPEYDEPVLRLGVGRTATIRLGNPPGENMPEHHGYDLVEAEIARSKRGSVRLVAKNGWTGALLRVAVRNLDFPFGSLARDLVFWPGGEGDPVVQAGKSKDPRKEQLFAFRECEAILVADRKNAVAHIQFSAGNLHMRPARPEEVADCIVSRALLVHTPQAYAWATNSLERLGFPYRCGILHERWKALRKERHAAGTA